MSPYTTPPTPKIHPPRVILDGAVVTIMQKFPHLIREPYGDEVEGASLRCHAWSALRMLRRVGQESDDDEDICTAAEESEKVASVILNALEIMDSSPRTSSHEGHGHRLCPCQRYVELGRMALMLGKKFWVPLINGQYSGTGPSEPTRLRTFYLSLERPHVVFLEFQVLSKRVEQSNGSSQTPKVIVELYEERLSLKRDIEAKGITIDITDD